MADERWFEVGGRRWRRTDPDLPGPLRAELQSELGSARATVRLALQADDGAAVAAARARVGDAKVALGERGRPWWLPPTDASLQQRAAAAARALLAHRGSTSSICPSDVARVAGGRSWRSAMDPVRDVLRTMAERGEVVVTQHGRPVPTTSHWHGPVRVVLAAS